MTDSYLVLNKCIFQMLQSGIILHIKNNKVQIMLCFYFMVMIYGRYGEMRYLDRSIFDLTLDTQNSIRGPQMMLFSIYYTEKISG